jgi:hypothetical protein
MVAYDSRRMPDPAHLLSPEAIGLLRAALTEQRSAGRQPTRALVNAVRAASREARERQLPAEALVIQLKVLADEVGLPMMAADIHPGREVQEWMITACLRAYWNVDSSD